MSATQPFILGCQTQPIEPEQSTPGDDPCRGKENGALVNLGSPSGCEYPSACAEKGTSTIINEVCLDGAVIERVETQNCSRSTEGILVATSNPGVCQFESTCDLTGYTISTQIYCRGGDEVEESLIQYGCQRETDGLTCDDDNVCSRSSECRDGACRSIELVDCDDSNPCTDDSCDPSQGCTYQFNNAPCTDGDACTSNDLCQSGVCAGSPVNCDDSNPCTDGSCVEGQGCVYVTAVGPCDDGNACTADDQCVGGQCQGSTLVTCNDDNPCTNDTCKPSLGCENINNTLPCDDGDACTANDQCSDGACQAGGPRECDDDNPCTVDTCESTSGCIHTNNSAECDDEDICTSGDTCVEGQCVGTLEQCFIDDNPCTAEYCDPLLGCASETLDGVVIDVLSAAECQFDNTCDQSGTQSRNVTICRNGNLEEERDIAECIRSTDAVLCDDGAFCTVDDACLNGICTGSIRNCSDDNSCTFDTCSQALGCQHQDDTTVCSEDTINCQRYVVCRENATSTDDFDTCADEASEAGLQLYSSMTDCFTASGCGTDSQDPVCSLEFCLDPMVSCLGPDAEPNGAGSCADLRICLDSCTGVSDCRSECLNHVSADEFQRLLDLNECGREQQCLQIDGSYLEQCLEENCAETYSACNGR